MFVFSALSLLLIGFGYARGKIPVHRPDKEYLLKLLNGIETKSTRVEEWECFIGYPVHHDPELEALRQALLRIHEGDGTSPAAKEGINGYIYDREGRARVEKVRQTLQKMLEEGPSMREF